MELCVRLSVCALERVKMTIFSTDIWQKFDFFFRLLVLYHFVLGWEAFPSEYTSKNSKQRATMTNNNQPTICSLFFASVWTYDDKQQRRQQERRMFIWYIIFCRVFSFMDRTRLEKTLAWNIIQIFFIDTNFCLFLLPQVFVSLVPWLFYYHWIHLYGQEH